MSLIVDVRTREEYVMDHVKGALNIPLFDLEYYLDFLGGKGVSLYCSSGRRSGIAAGYLKEKGIDASVIPLEELAEYEREGKDMICALNYLSVKPGVEEEFEEMVEGLCRITVEMPGFLGSKIFRASTVSYGGTGLRGEYQDIEIKPTKYIMLTYWTSKEAHEEFHKRQAIQDGFMEMMKYVSVMPFEEYGEIIR